jgi:O-antigen/teichoic acid export membrane protein
VTQNTLFKQIEKHLSNIRALQTFQVMRYAVLFVTGMLFAQAGLSTELIGLYEKLLFFASVLSFFWVSGFIQALLASHGTVEEGQRSRKLFSVFIVVMLCSILSFILFRMAAGSFIESDDKTVSTLVNLFSFYLLLANPAFLVEYIYLLLNKPKSIVMYGVVSFSVQLGLVVGPVFFADDTYVQSDVLYLSICGVVASAAFRFMWLVVLLFKNAELKVNAEHISSLLVIGSPLIVSAILSGSIEYINGFIVQHYFDDATFAIFRNGAKELPLAMLLANSFSNAMLPKFSDAQQLNQSLAELKQSALRLMHFLFPVTIVLMLLSKTLYPLLFNASFTASAGIFNIYLLLVVSRLVFPQTILIGMQKTKAVMFISLAEALTNIVCSIVLIQFAGVEGVAWGVFIAFTIEKILLVLYLKFKLNISIQHYTSVGWLLLYTVVTLTAYLFATFVI